MGRVISEGKNVALIGASPKQDRYAYRAFEMLREHGHHAIPINPAFHEIAGERCYASISEVPGPIHTVTLYLRADRSDPLTEQILAAKPARIIFNPGAENDSMPAGRGRSGLRRWRIARWSCCTAGNSKRARSAVIDLKPVAIVSPASGPSRFLRV